MKTKREVRVYLCQCECGRTMEVPEDLLLTGAITECPVCSGAVDSHCPDCGEERKHFELERRKNEDKGRHRA